MVIIYQNMHFQWLYLPEDEFSMVVISIRRGHFLFSGIRKGHFNGYYLSEDVFPMSIISIIRCHFQWTLSLLEEVIFSGNYLYQKMLFPLAINNIHNRLFLRKRIHLAKSSARSPAKQMIYFIE